MQLKFLTTAIFSCALVLAPVERVSADAGDFAAGALIGGLIGGALSNGGKRRQRGGTQRSRLPSTQEGKEIQSSLNYFGFDAGSVDGQLGRKTKTAVSQYQAYLGYPVSGQLSPYGQELLISSYKRAVSSGYLASQQAMAHPDGPRGLLKIYLSERMVPQPNMPMQNQQQFNQPQTMMVNTNPNPNIYGAPQQYGQSGQQPTYNAGAQANVQTYGAQGQYAPQGQYVPQGQQATQGQYAPQGQYAGQGQYTAPQGQYAPQVQQSPQGQFVPQAQFAAQGQTAPQGQVFQNGQTQAAPLGTVVAALPNAGEIVTASVTPQQTQPAVVPQNKRWALVIGVDNYDNVTALQKARNDAQAISQTLVGLGFEVSTLYDAGRRDINGAVSTMANKIDPGDEVLFYFAGHGVEVEGRNFLLPSDVPVINLGDESFLTGESIAADRVLETFQKRGARTTVMILDACRNNPFPSDGKRSVGGSRGLVRMDPPEGAFILYSAGAGQTALDRLSDNDANPNSVFTRALLPRLKDPSMTLHQLAKQVRRDVQVLASEVNHDQFPAYYDQMSGDLFLARTAQGSGN
ncbi:caspase family protein [Parasedimentitalea maritima]|uniref:Peptidase C14 n=1 Tax=Parasedimentitalea maritima TaxID=2578117 RepID=A0A6A4RFZ1_9RHOB|nr:caspase family protein [Zongyanglinia marina]KAE9630147.1 peptidase C14 [Zongyanglinia marina]